MTTAIKTDDVIFNFFKQICDEKDDQKCVELGNEWIKAMETNFWSSFSSQICLKKLKITSSVLIAVVIPTCYMSR